MRRSLLALGSAALGAAVLVAQGSAGQRTTTPTTLIPITVTITDAAIRVSPGSGARGATARFTLVNHGKKAHTFRLGAVKPRAGTQSGFVRTLKPNERSTLALFLDYRGTIPWAGTMPADRGKPGMKGVFRIT